MDPHDSSNAGALRCRDVGKCESLAMEHFVWSNWSEAVCFTWKGAEHSIAATHGTCNPCGGESRAFARKAPTSTTTSLTCW